MKTLALIFVMIPFMGMSTLAQNPDVQKLMDNKDAREEIYKTIMNDHNLMMEFLGDVQQNDHAKAMLQQHQAMYGSNTGNSQGMMMGSNQNMMGSNQNMMGNSQQMTGNQQHMMGNNQNMMGNSQQMTGNQQHMMSNNQNMMGMNQENIQRMNQMMGYFQENPELVPRMMGNMMDMCVSDSTLCEPMAEVMSHHPQMMKLGEQKMQENGQSETMSGK